MITVQINRQNKMSGQTKALNLALPFEAHSFNQNEEEFILHLEKGEVQDPHYLYIKEERLKFLHEIYMVLIPFYRPAEEFARAQDSKAIRTYQKTRRTTKKN